MDEGLDHAETRAAVRLIMDRTRVCSTGRVARDPHGGQPRRRLPSTWSLRENAARAEEVRSCPPEPRQLHGRGHRVRELGRGGVRRAVLAPFPAGQRARADVLGDMGRHEPRHRAKRAHVPPEGQVLLRGAGAASAVAGSTSAMQLPRVRAARPPRAISGDPACYLTDEEIGVAQARRRSRHDMGFPLAVRRAACVRTPRCARSCARRA